MERISQHLERHYKSFVDLDSPKGFFMGLANYVKFILETPALKKILDKEFSKRNSEYKKIGELEEASVAELIKAKNKLLKIIKDKGIDDKSISQNKSFIAISTPGAKEGVLEQLDKFEKGVISISGSYSSNLEHFLFDIAAGIKALGNEEEVKEFLVSNQEYGAYYAEMNGEGGGAYGGNIYGNFIFSKTLPIRHKQERALERARKIEIWGSYELLMKAWISQQEVLREPSFDQIIEDCKKYSEYIPKDKDIVDIIHATQDWKNFTKDTFEFNTNRSKSVGFLKINEYKPATNAAHLHLVQSLPKEKSERPFNREAATNALRRKSDEAWKEDVNVKLERMMSFMEESLAKQKVEQEQEQDELGKWWKKDDRPVYDPNSGKLSLSTMSFVVSKDAEYERKICEIVFTKKTFGDWTQYYEAKVPEKAFYYAIRRINSKAKDKLKVAGLLIPQMKRTRINKELFQVDSDEL